MFSVGDLHLHNQNHSNNNNTLMASRRHQTFIFWDYDSIHPTSSGTTAAHFYRKIKDHLKEKGVASGGVHGKAFVPAGTNNAVVLQLEDLQLHLYQGAKNRLQLEMAQALAAVGDHHNPTEVSIVVVSREKCYVRDIKQLADNGFEVFVVHDAQRGTAVADILETYATRSFHLKDILGDAGTPAPSATLVGSGGASTNATTATAATHHHSAHHTAPASLTVLVEGRRVTVDDLVRNEAVQLTLRQPTATGLRWCHTQTAHNVHDCPCAHPIAAASAALGGPVMGNMPPPPSYNQAVQHLGKSPMAGPVPPPPPAGTSPLMGFYPPPAVPSTSPPSGGGTGMLPRGLPPMHGVPLPPPSIPHRNHQQQQVGGYITRGAGSSALVPSSSSSSSSSAVNNNAGPATAHAVPTTSATSSVIGGPTNSTGGGAWGDSYYQSPSSIQDAMEELLSKLTVPDALAVSSQLASTTAAAAGGSKRGDDVALLGDPTAVEYFSSLSALAAGVSSPTSPSLDAALPKEAPVVVAQRAEHIKASSSPTVAEAAQAVVVKPASLHHTKKSLAVGTTTATPNVWLRGGAGGGGSSGGGDCGGSRTASGAKSNHVDVASQPPDLPTLESLGTSHRSSNPSGAAPPGGGQAASSSVGYKGSSSRGGGGAKASFASIVGSGGGKPAPPPPSPAAGGNKKGGAGGAAASSSSTGASKPPRELNIDGHMVPLDQLVHNKFVDACLRDGVASGRYCTDTRAHSIMDCAFAHRDKYPLLQGGEVDGKTLLVNKALENLRGNTSYKGNFCTSPKPHDALKCTYLHRKGH